MRASYRAALSRFTHRSAGVVNVCGILIGTVAFLASIVCLVTFIIHVGFDHTSRELSHLGNTLRTVQAVFVIDVVFHMMFGMRDSYSGRRGSVLRRMVSLGILLTLIPLLYPEPRYPWIPVLRDILYSRKFLYAMLGAYATVTLSYGVLRIIGKRTNPSLMLSASFLVFILVGSFLLMLPKCTYGSIGYPDALFVSTSAVCITGLTPIDISVRFTPLGLLVLSLLIQIGGLGVMTFTSFFALFFSGNTSIYSQLMLKDVIYSKSMSALIPTLLYILGFTLVVEAVGAVCIFLSVHNTLGMSLNEEIVFSAFHSLSAFCNAGFTNIAGGMSNPHLLHGNLSIYWIMSALIIAGSIGFPILVNFKDAAVLHLHRLWRKLHHRSPGIRTVYIYNMNTRIVLSTFMILFVAGAVIFFWWEYDNALRGLTLPQKITQSVFNSAVPRSAGFSSLNPAGFLNITIVLIMFLMWIGGASQSTGGGIKVNTFAAIVLNLWSIIRGRDRVTAFKRTVAIGSIRRANSVVAISILSYLFYSLALMYLEPDLPPRALLFEACSALFTVGSSLGVTHELSTASEILLCTAMFLGRVGILSLLTGISGSGNNQYNVRFPEDNIIIN